MGYKEWVNSRKCGHLIIYRELSNTQEIVLIILGKHNVHA